MTARKSLLRLSPLNHVEAMHRSLTEDLMAQGSPAKVENFEKRAKQICEKAAEAGKYTKENGLRAHLGFLIDFWISRLRRLGVDIEPLALAQNPNPKDEPIKTTEAILRGLLFSPTVGDETPIVRHRKLEGISFSALGDKKEGEILGPVLFHDCLLVNCDLRGVSWGLSSRFVHTTFWQPDVDIAQDDHDDQDEPEEKLRAAGASFKDCVFEGIDLRNADFRGAHLDNSVIRGCKMNSSTHFERASFMHAVLEGIHAVGSKFARSLFCDSALRGSSFPGSDFKNSVFTNAIFEDSSFEKCDFFEADFSQVDFRDGASFLGAEFDSARFHGASGFENASWAEGKLKGAIFSEQQLENKFIKALSKATRVPKEDAPRDDAEPQTARRTT